MKLKAFFLLMLLAVPQYSQGAFSCLQILRREARTAIGLKPGDKKLKRALKFAALPPRIIFYPIEATRKVLWKTAQSPRSVLKVPVQVLREDYLLLLSFLALVQSQDDKFIQSYEYDLLSEDFDKNEDNDLLVIADIHSEDDIKFGWGDTLLETKYPQFKRKRVITAQSYQELLQKLQEIARQEGPIGRLEIRGHGFYGRLSVDPTPAPQDRGYATNDSVLRQQRVQGVFKAGAQIRVSTCLSGRGPEGDVFMDGLAYSLLDQGGTVYASTVVKFVDDELAFMAGLGKRSRHVLGRALLGEESFINLVQNQDILDPIPGEPKVKVRHYGAH